MSAEKNRKMAQMGVPDVDHPVTGETIVELSLHFVFRDNEKDEQGNKMPTQIFLYVEAEQRQILMKKPLEEIIGKTVDHYWRNHYPYDSWADDVERQDFWSDAVADPLRPLNKVLNSWFSQMVENRTLRNFGMHYYDATKEGFAPQSFNPVPWGWYGVPGKPQEVLQKVEIPDLSESLDEMNFIITMAEKVSGATSTQQGVQTERKITLGEVQLALGEAKERIKGMSKFYTPSWERTGEMFSKLIEAASDKLDAVKIYKQGRNTDNIYSREISPSDWMTKSGYRCRVWSQDEKKAADTEKIQILGAVRTNIPGNPKLEDIFKRELLEIADLPPDDINTIMEFETARAEAMASMNATQIDPATGQPIVQPPQQAQPLLQAGA